MDTRTQIKNHLLQHGIKPLWFAKRLNVQPHHVYLLLRKERPLTQELLNVINEIWPGVTFELEEDPPAKPT